MREKCYNNSKFLKTQYTNMHTCTRRDLEHYRRGLLIFEDINFDNFNFKQKKKQKQKKFKTSKFCSVRVAMNFSRTLFTVRHSELAECWWSKDLFLQRLQNVHTVRWFLPCLHGPQYELTSVPLSPLIFLCKE